MFQQCILNELYPFSNFEITKLQHSKSKYVVRIVSGISSLFYWSVYCGDSFAVAFLSQIIIVSRSKKNHTEFGSGSIFSVLI